MPADTYISLKELNQLVSSVIDDEFYEGVWILAEINTLQERGHCYLELIEKDAERDAIVAKASATIWRNLYIKLRMDFYKVTGNQLSAGMKVLVKVKPNFHPQYGFSLNIIDIDPSYTVGDAAIKRAAVVSQLKEDGVYDLNKELEIPTLIKRIAVISSSGAAGYGDFMNHLSSNPDGYSYRVTLFEALMQGESAEASIIGALDAIASRLDEFDIVVIVRGGGATSDLSCYDKYDLAAAVAQFPLPVITGIGHDRDLSVVDEVACLHLKTPTAVAAFIIDSTAQAEQRLRDIVQGFNECVRYYIELHKSRLEVAKNNIAVMTGIYMERQRSLLEMAQQTLELTSPQNILKKGYSMTQAGGRVVTSVKGLKEGEIITTIFADGCINSIIK